MHTYAHACTCTYAAVPGHTMDTCSRGRFIDSLTHISDDFELGWYPHITHHVMQSLQGSNANLAKVYAKLAKVYAKLRFDK